MKKCLSLQKGLKCVFYSCILIGLIFAAILPACILDKEKIAVLITGWGDA